MTETEQLADIIALSIHAATEPLLRKLAVLEARPVGYATKEAWDALQDTLADLRARLGTVEAKAPILGLPGPPGAQGEMGTKGLDGAKGERGEAGLNGKDGVNGLNGKNGADGLDGKDGRDGLDGKDGRDGVDGKDGAPGLNGQDGRDGVDGKDGRDGLNGTDGDVGPAGKDGRDGLHGKDGQSVTLDDVMPLLVRELQARVDALPLAKDGVGLVDALINRDRHLILTLSNGTITDVGVVVGKDGAPGMDGEEMRRTIAEEVKKIPVPANGKDGAPGLGFDDLDVTFDEQHGVQLAFERGTQKKAFALPVPFYAGVWTAGRLYPKGANVTVRGAIYVALEPTRTRPEDGSAESAKAWRLAVKGGRDGKPGKDGKDGIDA